MRELKVYFGQDLLPYKDKEHQVHFPIVGNAFQGASQTDIIKFYIGEIALNDSAVWVACSKLPTGEPGYNLLDTRGNDDDGSYVQLALTRWHTQYQGNLYICLHCYAGGIELEEDEETHLLTPVGEPVIRVTGGIKMNIAYATGIIGGDDIPTHTLEELWAKFGEYLRLDDNHYFKVLNVITDINNELYKDYIENGDIVLAKPTIADTNYSVYKISGTYPEFTYSMLGIQISGLTVNNIIANQINVPTFADIKRGDNKALSTYIEEEIDEVAQTKVDKTSDGLKVYGTGLTGNQITLNYSNTVIPNGLVTRTGVGQILVPLEPTANNYAASKKYVDDKVAEFAQNEMQVVSVLPASGEEGIIYLLPIDPTDLTKGYYRYIWELVGENYQWLSLGTTEVDLSNYQEKLTAGSNISISSNNTIRVVDDPSFDELRVDNGQYQLYVESLSNDMAGISYTSGDLASSIRIYQGVPEISNESSNYKLSFRVGTTDIDIEVKDYTNDTTTTVSLLATLNGKQDTLVSGTNIKTLNGVSLLGSGNIDYDNALNDSSTNAVQNKVLKGYIDDLSNRLTVLEESIIADETLTYTYLIQSAIPTNVSSYPIIESAGMDNTDIKGHSFVYNQLIRNGNFVDTNNWGTSRGTISVSNNECTYKITTVGTDNDANRISQTLANDIPANKKVIISFSFYALHNSTGSITLVAPDGVHSTAITLNYTTGWNRIEKQVEWTYAIHTIWFAFNATNGGYSIDDEVKFKNAQAINLTQSGLGSVTTVDEAIAELAKRNINIYEYNEYSEGKIIDTKPTALVSKDSNNNVLGTYSLTLPVLRSAGSAQDDTKKVKIGIVDLGTLNYTKSGGVPQRFSTNGISSLIATPDNDDTLCNTLCVKYVSSTRDIMISGSPVNMSVAVSSGGTLYIANEDFFSKTAEELKTAMSGVYLYYELATPTDQPSITLPENIEFEKGGSLEVEYDSTDKTPSDFDFEVAVYKPME